MEQKEKKRQFTSMRDACDALPQKEREHGIRAAEYAQAIFLEACSSQAYKDDEKAKQRLIPGLSAAVAEAVKGMDIGKAALPERYQDTTPGASPQETELYRSHVAEGVKLLESLPTENGEDPDVRAVRLEILSGHHEQWNGEGFPAHTKETETPVLARIAALADALDLAASRKRSEKPFEFALTQLQAGAGTLYDPELVALALSMKSKLKKVFTKYISQTRIIPEIRTVVRRRGARPFCLWYRPIADVKTNRSAAFEAQTRFRGKGKELLPYAEVEHIVKKENLLPDLGIYFLIELCDTLRRMDISGIPASYIAITPPPGFLGQRGLVKEIKSVLEDTGTEAKRLCFTVDAQLWAAKTKTAQENLKKISALGCRVLFSGFEVGGIGAEELRENGATHLRLAAGAKLEDARTTEYLEALSAAGIVPMADGVDKKKPANLYRHNKIACATGALFGDYQPEDGVIEKELAADL